MIFQKLCQSVRTILFADDTTLYATGVNKNCLFDTIKSDLELLIDWFRANKLSLNISKTNYVLFKPKRLKLDDSATTEDPILKFGNEIIRDGPIIGSDIVSGPI